MFYFGSRARGDAGPRSDYDVGIETKEPIPLEVMAGIRAEVKEINVLQKMDVVDFSRVSGKFRQKALQEANPSIRAIRPSSVLNLPTSWSGKR